MEQLRGAVAMGFRSPEAYRTEDTLTPLRNRTDFRLLMMDLVMPAKPFAMRPVSWFPIRGTGATITSTARWEVKKGT